MAEFVATMTSKGQLTVPVAVRRKLGLDAGDQVAFVIDDEGGARLRRRPAPPAGRRRRPGRQRAMARSTASSSSGERAIGARPRSSSFTYSRA